jgi:hypothetical protein
MAHNQYPPDRRRDRLIGLASFLWLLWVSVRSAWKAAHADDVVVKEAGTIAFVSLLGMLWGMYLDFYGGMQVYYLVVVHHGLYRRRGATRREAGARRRGRGLRHDMRIVYFNYEWDLRESVGAAAHIYELTSGLRRSATK